ncbi:MAG: hypothetical protein A2X81_01605 [Desulfobacterales bacterium GWB2_56_26]|nr:MAG: hypothetical protein A2X81_01605 [Desulfobacterales bacterium GWB2_56_26]
MSSFPDLFNLIRHIDEQLTEAAADSAALMQTPKSIPEKLTKYILVGAGNLHLAIAIEDMAEVGPLPAITFLPNLPAWIQGIVNIRSEIISVVDLPVFLGLAETGGAGSRFVVLHQRKLKVGIRLDSIIGTVGRFASDIKPLDAFDGNRLDKSLFHSGLLVEKRFYFILNVRKLLTAPRLVDYNRAG